MNFIFDPWSLTYTANFLVLAFITYLFYKTRSSKRSKLGGMILVLASFMLFAGIITMNAAEEEIYRHGFSVFVILATTISVGYLHMALYWGKPRPILSYWQHLLIYLPLMGMVLVFIRAPEDFILNVVQEKSYYGQFTSRLTLSAAPFMVYAHMFCPLTGMAVLHEKYKASPIEDEKLSLRYLMLVPIFPMVLVTMEFSLSTLGIRGPVSPSMATWCIPGILLGFATLRYNILDIENKLREAVTSFSTALFFVMVLITWSVLLWLALDNIFLFVLFNIPVFLFLTLMYENLRARITNFIEGLSPQLKWKECKAEEVFLINSRDGALLSHVRDRSDQHNVDPELVSGMLSALIHFVKDTFRAGGQEELRMIRVGDKKMMVEHSKNLFLAVLFSGFDSMELRDDIQGVLEAIESDYRMALKKDLIEYDDFDKIDRLLRHTVFQA